MVRADPYAITGEHGAYQALFETQPGLEAWPEVLGLQSERRTRGRRYALE